MAEGEAPRPLGIRARREALLDRIHETGERSVDDLACVLRVSAATVRRDLSALERQGLVDRTWGGAHAHVALRYREDFERRARDGLDAKRAVARAALPLIEANAVVGLSGGTTVTLLARMLRGRPVNVVTNAVNVAAELFGARGTKVIVSGGALKANSYELVGAAADAIIRGYHLDVFVFSCSGVGVDGCFRRDHAEAAVVRTFCAVSARRVLLLERSKLGRDNHARVARFDEIDDVFVDGPLDPAWRERLAAGGARVHVVAPSTR
jgi:DeoR family transcriptional regulator, aga operon transcriptional repressor